MKHPLQDVRGARPMARAWTLGMAVGADSVFCGPYAGEFGWELMWAGILRKETRGARRIVVCSRPGTEALYDDFATEFLPHDIKCEGNFVWPAEGSGVTAETMERFVPTDVEFIIPPLTYGPPRVCGEFRRYGTPRAEYAGSIVIHARNRPYIKQRNWPLENWNRVARWLFERAGVKRIVCVGTPAAAVMVEGALDLRGAPLREQMDAMASARLAIGASSGPMHLAQHCGCPVVVWCGGGPSEQAETQSRYLTKWNPWKAPASAHRVGGWHPPVPSVAEWVCKMLLD